MCVFLYMCVDNFSSFVPESHIYIKNEDIGVMDLVTNSLSSTRQLCLIY